jgi:hypothetical protein
MEIVFRNGLPYALFPPRERRGSTRNRNPQNIQALLAEGTENVVSVGENDFKESRRHRPYQSIFGALIDNPGPCGRRGLIELILNLLHTITASDQ